MEIALVLLSFPFLRGIAMVLSIYIHNLVHAMSRWDAGLIISINVVSLLNKVWNINRNLLVP